MSRHGSAHRTAIVILVCLTLLKLAAWTALQSRGKVHTFVGDNATTFYIPIARRLLTEGRFNGPDSRGDSKVPPGYPLLVAGSMAVSGNSYQQLIPLLQMLMDLATALILYWAMFRLSLPKTGILAGCIWLLYPPAIAISTWITAEPAFTTLFTLGLALFAISAEKQNGKLAFAAGLVMGCATLFRGTPLVLPLALLPACWKTDGLQRWALFTAGMALLVTPWCVRNLLVLDELIPVATGTGSVILQGSDERFFTGEGKRTLYPSTIAAAAADGVIKPATDHESKLDGWLGKIGWWVQLQRLKRRPLSLIPFFAHKFVRVWYGTESGGFRQQAVLGFCSLLVAPAGFWELWKWRKIHAGAAYVLLSAVAYIVVMHMFLLPEARYTLPIVPTLILGASAQLARLGIFHRVTDHAPSRRYAVAPEMPLAD